jgi:hypothetical protein
MRRCALLLTAAILTTSRLVSADTPPPEIPARPAHGRRADNAMLLFKFRGHYVPLICRTGGKVLTGQACAKQTRPRGQMLTARGVRIALSRVERFDIGEGTPEPDALWGFAIPKRPEAEEASDGDSAPAEVQDGSLAVWPADADLALTAVGDGTALDAAELAALHALTPPRPRHKHRYRKGPEFAVLQQVVLAGSAGRAASFFDDAGVPTLAVQRGPALPWQTIIADNDNGTASGIRVMATFELAGQPHVVIFTRCANDFAIEVRSADLQRSLFRFDYGSV